MPRHDFSLLALAALCVAALPAEAKETAKVLPKSIFRARIVGVTTSAVSDTFGDTGRLQGLGHSLNRSVTVNDLANSAGGATGAGLQSLVHNLNQLQSGLGDSLAVANMHSDFSVRQRVVLGALEYGLTSRLSLGVRAPIVTRTVKNRLRVDTVNNAQAVSAALGSLSPAATAGLASLGANPLDAAFFENALFVSKGYAPPRDFERTQLGDVEAGGKYLFYSNDVLYSTVLVGVSLPTGAKSDLRNPFDKGNSKEAFCGAVQLFQEAQLTRGWSVGGAAKLGYSLADTRDRAVPLNETDSLPSLLPEKGQVQSVRRQRGAQLETELAAAYRFKGEAVGLWSAYQYSQKDQDKYRGPGNLYYQGLSRQSDWRLHAAEVGAEYSSINAFRRGKFPIPLEVTLLYNRPLRGTNTPMAPYARMDVMVYF